jgi:hypothetical protein
VVWGGAGGTGLLRLTDGSVAEPVYDNVTPDWWRIIVHDNVTPAWWRILVRDNADKVTRAWWLILAHGNVTPAGVVRALRAGGTCERGLRLRRGSRGGGEWLREPGRSGKPHAHRGVDPEKFRDGGESTFLGIVDFPWRRVALVVLSMAGRRWAGMRGSHEPGGSGTRVGVV